MPHSKVDLYFASVFLNTKFKDIVERPEEAMLGQIAPEFSQALAIGTRLAFAQSGFCNVILRIPSLHVDNPDEYVLKGSETPETRSCILETLAIFIEMNFTCLLSYSYITDLQPEFLDGVELAYHLIGVRDTNQQASLSGMGACIYIDRKSVV